MRPRRPAASLKEKYAMATPEEMDAAAQEAAAELEALRAEHPEAVNLVTTWWQKHHTAAGHKRLGRVLVGKQARPRERAGTRDD
jgi:hypothetical protein